MRLVRAALELGVVLNADIKVVFGDLDGLHDVAVRRQAGEHEPLFLHERAVVVVELVPVAVALGDVQRAVALRHFRAGHDVARICAEAQRAALVDLIALVGHEVDDLVRATLVELAGVGVGEAADGACKLDDRDLHTQADAEIGDIVRAGIVRGRDLALNAAVAEAAGHENAVAAAEHFLYIIARDRLAVNPLNVHARAVDIAGVAQRLGDGQIRIVQLHVFAHEADRHAVRAAADALEHGIPLGHIRRGRVDVQLTADDLGKAVLFEHDRCLIQHGDGHVFDHAVGLDVAEQGDFAEDGLLERLIAAQHDDVRGNAHALQLLDRVLRGLGLVLLAAVQIRHERHVDVECVFAPDLQADLTDGLEKRLALNVAGRAADLRDNDVGVRLAADTIDKVLDLIRDVRNDLHRLAEVLAAALLVEHVPVHLAGREVGVFVQILVDEALIVAEVEIGLRAVLGNVHLAVLIRAHGAGVDIDIGVKLLRGDLQAACLEQTAERSRRDAFAESGDNAAGHKNVLGHGPHSSIFIGTNDIFRNGPPAHTGVHCLFLNVFVCLRLRHLQVLHEQELRAVDDADIGDLRLELFRLVLHLLELDAHGGQQPDGLHDERFRRVIRQHQHAGLFEQGGVRVRVFRCGQQQHGHAVPLFELQRQLPAGAVGDGLCDEYTVDAACVKLFERLPRAACVIERDDARPCEQGADALGLRLGTGDQERAHGMQRRVHSSHLESEVGAEKQKRRFRCR